MCFLRGVGGQVYVEVCRGGSGRRGGRRHPHIMILSCNNLLLIIVMIQQRSKRQRLEVPPLLPLPPRHTSTYTCPPTPLLPARAKANAGHVLAFVMSRFSSCARQSERWARVGVCDVEVFSQQLLREN